jgi:5-(carboxyamino)imidazole ribonucleotide mutase
MKDCAMTLEKFGIAHELVIASAHRSPDRLAKYVAYAENHNVAAFIAAAGMAAHLAGAVASRTSKPVIGVPMASGALNGVDALYSTVQMPPKMPVACVAINGAINAAYLALQILAVSDPEVAKKLAEDRAEIAAQVEKDSALIEKIL